MKKFLIPLLPVMLCCKQPATPTTTSANPTAAARIFAAGILLSQRADSAGDTDDIDKAIEFNQQAIDSFNAVLLLEPDFSGVHAAMAHALFIDARFEDALRHFDLQFDKNANAYQEMGLCKMNTGKVGDGRKDIDLAFVMDTSKAFRSQTIRQIETISDVAYEGAQGLKKEGKYNDAEGYEHLSAFILMVALDYDKSDKRMEKKWHALVKKTGSEELESYFQ